MVDFFFDNSTSAIRIKWNNQILFAILFYWRYQINDVVPLNCNRLNFNHVLKFFFLSFPLKNANDRWKCLIKQLKLIKFHEKFEREEKKNWIEKKRNFWTNVIHLMNRKLNPLSWKTYACVAILKKMNIVGSIQ